MVRAHRGRPDSRITVTEFLAGLSIGLGAGLAPGPLLALVVTTSLERGFGAGVRVAVAPLITDLPIVALSVWVAASISATAVRALGVGGGLLVAAVGVHTALRAQSTEAAVPPAGGDMLRGVAVNALSPHPWIFWLVAGGPLLVAAWGRAPFFGVAFLAGFYGLLVGSKIAVAAVVARTARNLSPAWRGRLVVGGAALLVAGGMVLVWEGLSGRL
ncbi:MAG: hypothetical protein A2Z12_04540 [Actinobacteria bacterium RBG_16_68_21]|nr:MAG: hypothetical protein A2Z12_04540 [Actinobacteria bacterium RBG_16_68_21]